VRGHLECQGLILNGGSIHAIPELTGKVDGVVITGGIAYNDRFVSWIEKRTKFIAPIFVFPGEDELKALADGALRVLHHMEEAKTYE